MSAYRVEGVPGSEGLFRLVGRGGEVLVDRAPESLCWSVLRRLSVEVELCESDGMVVWAGTMAELRLANAHDAEVLEACDRLERAVAATVGALEEPAGLYRVRAKVPVAGERPNLRLVEGEGHAS